MTCLLGANDLFDTRSFMYPRMKNIFENTQGGAGARNGQIVTANGSGRIGFVKYSLRLRRESDRYIFRLLFYNVTHKTPADTYESVKRFYQAPNACTRSAYKSRVLKYYNIYIYTL